MKQIILILFLSISIIGIGNSQTCGFCPGGSKTLTANPVGASPYTYSWSGGGTSQSKTVTTAGTHTVTVTDANGCTATASQVVIQFTPPTASLVATNGSCGNLGAIANTVTGGSTPYTFAWSNGANTEDLTGLANGTYTVTVTDSNGCTDSESATITNTTGASVTISCN